MTNVHAEQIAPTRAMSCLLGTGCGSVPVPAWWEMGQVDQRWLRHVPMLGAASTSLAEAPASPESWQGEGGRAQGAMGWVGLAPVEKTSFFPPLISSPRAKFDV